MISVLIKGRNLYRYAYSEDGMKRHKERRAIYKPKQTNKQNRGLEEILPSKLPEGMNSANTLISDISPPEI